MLMALRYHGDASTAFSPAAVTADNSRHSLLFQTSTTASDCSCHTWAIYNHHRVTIIIVIILSQSSLVTNQSFGRHCCESSSPSPSSQQCCPTTQLSKVSGMRVCTNGKVHRQTNGHLVSERWWTHWHRLNHQTNNSMKVVRTFWKLSDNRETY